jgi:cytoskeleton protein RodZ
VSDSATTGEHAGAGSASAPAERPEAAGAALLKERRRQGLSLGDISRQLKLSVRQVEALERDDYSAYKGPVFIHGFIRNYAKLLGLDPEPLIRATDAMLNPPQSPPATPPGVPERARPVRAKQIRFRLWHGVVALLVIGIAMSVFFGGRRQQQDPARVAASGAARDKIAPVPKVTGDARPGAESKSRIEPKADAEPVTRPAAKPTPRIEPKTEIKPEAAVRSAPADSGSAIAAEPGARITVRMIFEQASWVEIKDRNGNPVFGQLNPAGSRRSASGEPPLNIVVGNAVGVRLFLGDKAIDLAPHTRVDVARLTLE